MKNVDSITFIKRYVRRSHIAILTLLSILSSALLVAVAFMTKLVIDAVSMADTSGIVSSVVVAVCLLCVYALALGFTNYLATKFSMIATRDIVSSSHHTLLMCPFDSVKSLHSVEALKIVSNDAEIAVSTYIKLYPTIASIIVKLVAGISIMLYISSEITLIALAVGLVVGVALFLAKKPLKAMHKTTQEKVAISNAYMQESLRNVEVVKALDIADNLRAGVTERLECVRSALEKRAKLLSVINSVLYLALEATFLFIVVYGGTLITQGRLQLEDFIVLISLVEIVKSPFMTAANISSSIYSMLASAERVRTIIAHPLDEYMALDFDAIVFDHVSYSYDSNNVIDDLSCTIKKGHKVAILGDSGTGKSTFIRLLLGIIKPSSGEIYLLKDNKRVDIGTSIFKMGYVPQNIELFKDTIKANLAVSDTSRIESALRFADIYDEVMAKGLDSTLSEGGQGVSQGQMQRIAIARAMLADSEVLLFDEPFSALDKATAQRIFDRLMTLDKTLVIASHDDFVADAITETVRLGGQHHD